MMGAGSFEGVDSPSSGAPCWFSSCRGVALNRRGPAVVRRGTFGRDWRDCGALQSSKTSAVQSETEPMLGREGDGRARLPGAFKTVCAAQIEQHRKIGRDQLDFIAFWAQDL